MLSLRVIWPGFLLAGLLGSMGAADSGSPSPIPAQGTTGDMLDQLAVDEPVTADKYARPVPKARPRLRDGDMLSEKGRLRVHGGMSFTVGASSEGSFHGGSGWVSYYDPVTGLGLSFGYSHFSGKGLPLEYSGYPYSSHYGAVPGSYYYPVPLRAQPVESVGNAPLFMRGASKASIDADTRGTLLADRDGRR
jgi:hypothetical protein